MATTNELGNCSKVHLTLHVPTGRTKQMRKLLKPLLRPADPSLSLSHVHESESPILRSDLRPPRDGVPKYCVGSEVLTTPALSLMTFLPDGTADESRGRLRDFPWKLHHKIELQNSDGGGGCCGFVSGKQEFYSLSRQYPLCCVSPSPSAGSCTVRFNLFVRNYRAMLEFYRLLADSEMESTKADFAVFTVNAANGGWSSSSSALLSSPYQLSSSSSSFRSSSSSSRRVPNLMCCVQLALKHSPYLDPYPLTSAYLTFFVRNMTALRTVLPGKAAEVAPNTFVVRDPDGNCVIVHDVEPAFVRSRSPRGGRLFSSGTSRARLLRTGTGTGSARHAALLVDGGVAASTGSSSAGKRSYCDSQDSGRFSDSERGSSELDQCLERLVREVSLNITDYSDSSSSSSCETDSDPLYEGVDAARRTEDLRGGEVVGRTKVQIGGLADIQHVQRKKKMVYL